MSLAVGIADLRAFLGWHVAVYLKTMPDLQIQYVTQDTLFESLSLESFVRQSDVIFYFVEMLGEEHTLINTSRVEAILTAIDRISDKIQLFIVDCPISFGFQKQQERFRYECFSLFEKRFLHLKDSFWYVTLPKVFGEFDPDSLVLKLLDHIVNKKEFMTTNQDASFELLHAQVVAQALWRAAQEKRAGELQLRGQEMNKQQLIEKISEFHKLYSEHIFPDVRDNLNRDLFNTYRSYLFPQMYPRYLSMHSDVRGSLFESVKTYSCGQTFLSTTKPGITRGNHYHLHKIERFLVISGEAEIKVRQVLSSQTITFRVSGSRPAYVDIPTLHTHNITNVGSTELVTLFWTHELFQADAPDTTAELV